VTRQAAAYIEPSRRSIQTISHEGTELTKECLLGVLGASDKGFFDIDIDIDIEKSQVFDG